MKNVVWITGGSGFIGHHLSIELHSLNFDVCIINREQSIIRRLSSEEDIILEKGTNNSVSIFKILTESFGPPSMIFHLAGTSSVGQSFLKPYQSYIDTVELTVKLLEFVRLNFKFNETRILVTSSAAVYGDEYEGEISEKKTTKPCSTYGYHKLMVELICKNYSDLYGLNVVITRIFSVYGINLRKQLLWDICNKLSRNSDFLQLSGSGNELRDWIHVSDVVKIMILLLMDNEKYFSIINIGRGKGIAVKEIAETAKTFFEASMQINFSNEKRLGDPFSLIADTTYLSQRLLNYNYKNINFGIEEYVRWYKNLPK